MHPHKFITHHVKVALQDQGESLEQSEKSALIALQWYKELSTPIKGESLISKLIKIASTHAKEEGFNNE